MCFDRGSQKRKLDNYLNFFQVLHFPHLKRKYLSVLHPQMYILSKDSLPMDVEFMLYDSLEVGPSTALFLPMYLTWFQGRPSKARDVQDL